MVSVLKQSSVDPAGLGIRSGLDNHHGLFFRLYGFYLRDHS